MNELEKQIEARLKDETWDYRIAGAVVRKQEGLRRLAALAAAALIVLGLGFLDWQSSGQQDLQSVEPAPYVFSDSSVGDDATLDLMASGMVFE